MTYKERSANAVKHFEGMLKKLSVVVLSCVIS